jgi:hypothetical protein
MSSYRLYAITPDEHIQAPAEVVECVDDRAAIDHAKQLLDGRVIEVWQLDRFVTRLKPKR